MTEIMIRQQKNTLRMTVVTAFITTFMGSALNLSVPALASILLWYGGLY